MKKKIKYNFNHNAHKYDEHAELQRKVVSELFKISKPDIGDKHIILDLGSGTGIFHEKMRSNKLKSQIVQLDLAYKMCHIAREYSAPISYGKTDTINADMDLPPFKPASFDIIFSSLAMQWSENLHKLLINLYNILKKDGTIYFSILTSNSLWQLANIMKQIDGINRCRSFYKNNYITDKLHLSGFKINDIVEIEYLQKYQNIKILLSSIKSIGGNYYNANIAYPGRNYFCILQNKYQEQFVDETGNLTLSWNVLFCKATKI